MDCPPEGAYHRGMEFRRYSAGARLYDILSGERWVYGAGRAAGLRIFGLRPGDVVLDLGCGTGLNFALLRAAVGPTGRVIGLDRSSEMLEVARSRVTRHGWTNVTLVQADATEFDAADLRKGGVDADVDAVIATYSLSVIRQWRAAWANARGVLKPGGRALVVDMQVPTGAARILAPLAYAMCAFGGSDITAHPWTILERDGTDITAAEVKGSHIRAVAASIA